MGKELEFKLAAANDAILDCLLGDPETAARMEGPIVCTPMETTYFDTETNAFRTNHWTLRRRQEGSRSVVCVKTPQPEPFARGEWEVEARAVDDAAIEWLLDFGAPRQLLQLYGEAPLRPVCGARFLRRSVMLRLADGSLRRAGVRLRRAARQNRGASVCRGRAGEQGGRAGRRKGPCRPAGEAV